MKPELARNVTLGTRTTTHDTFRFIAIYLKLDKLVSPGCKGLILNDYSHHVIMKNGLHAEGEDQSQYVLH